MTLPSLEGCFRGLVAHPFVLVLAMATAAAGCSDDKQGTSGGADTAAASTSGDVVTADSATGDATADAGPPDSGSNDTGVGATCPPPVAGPNTVRARLLGCAADLPTGPMAAARVGDFVLENNLVRFVLRAGKEGEATLGLVAGDIIDAVRIGKDGKQRGGDSLREWIPTVAFHLVDPTDITVVSDGSTGEARIRVAGGLVPFQTVHAFLPMDKPNLTVFHEYVLKPGQTSLEIRTVATPTDGQVDTSLVGDVTFWGGQLGLFRPGSGDPDSAFSPASKATTLGLTAMRADPALMPCALGFSAGVSIIDASGILAFLQPSEGGVPVAGRTFVRRLVVGGDGDAGLAAAMATAGLLAGEKYGTLAGKVADMWLGVEVELLDDKGRPLTRCAPAADGAFACPAPIATRGARAIWVGNGEGQAGGLGQAGASVAVEVKEGVAATVALTAPAAARLTVKVRTDKGENTAFQARLDPSGDAAPFGSRTFVDGDGDATFLLPAGTWQVWLHHGPEWSAHGETVTLAAGKTKTIEAKLSHVMDTTGWIACDMHVHAEHSIDSEVPNRERILDAISVGMDYVVATDHDYVTDYHPWLKAAGLTGRITVASGVEVSTAKFGHHNVWPLPHQPDKSGGGAVTWYNADALQLAKVLRGGDPKRVVQVNHPRGSQSYFSGIGFDAKKASAPDKKLLAFDAMELINSKRLDDTDQVLVDWFSLLDEGITPTGVGNSDSHSLSAGVGTARTWVWVGKDKGGVKGRDVQGAFTAGEADAAIKAGRAVASTGPLLVLELHAGAMKASIGDTLTGATGDVDARATLMAPEWMPLGTIEVYHNGALVHTEVVATAPTKSGLRQVTVSFKAPAATKAGWWTALHRPSAVTATPLVPRPVWAITNPVYETAK